MTRRGPRLLRRRELWVPTATGWLLLAVLAGAAGWLAVRGLYGFLAPNEPLARGVLVVEGWISDEAFDQAAEAWRGGRYAKVLTTGGPIRDGMYPASYPTYADYAAAALRARGVPAEAIGVVPTPESARDRTYLSAVLVREWIEQSGLPVEGVDVFSEGVHGRRTWRLYAQAFGGERPVGIRSATPSSYDPRAWWRTSAGAEELVKESVGWAWAACCFRPGARGSLAEKWDPP